MINPILVRIGPIAIHWYGVLVVGGALLSAYAAGREAKHRGQDPEVVWDMLIWILFLSIVGARLYHVFSTPAGGQLGWPYYRQHPLEAFRIWQGGLGIYGGLAGGVLGVATYAWRRHLDLVLWLDIISPCVLIGQAIGRWGNFVNQEVYGYPTDLPWGLYIAPERRLPGLERYDRFHPVFLYESIGCIVGFFVISWVSRKLGRRLLPGDRIAAYFVWYPAVRIFTESLRPDAWMVGGWPMAQVISIVMVVAATSAIVLRHTVLRPEVKPAS